MENDRRIPNGSWGWIVCFAGFMMNFTTVGLISTTGILLLALIDLYGNTVSQTAMVGSIFMGTINCVGMFSNWWKYKTMLLKVKFTCLLNCCCLLFFHLPGPFVLLLRILNASHHQIIICGGLVSTISIMVCIFVETVEVLLCMELSRVRRTNILVPSNQSLTFSNFIKLII